MQINTNSPDHCHDLSALPLFAFRQVVVAALATRAGLHLTRHYHVNPGIADLMASLAGLGNQEACQ